MSNFRAQTQPVINAPTFKSQPVLDSEYVPNIEMLDPEFDEVSEEEYQDIFNDDEFVVDEY